MNTTRCLLVRTEARLNRAWIAAITYPRFSTFTGASPITDDIPVIVKNSTISKAYRVNPMVSVARGLEKHCWLTKTVIAGDIPGNGNIMNTSQDTVDNFNAFLHQYSKRAARKGMIHFTEEEISHGVLYGLINLALSELKGRGDINSLYLDTRPELRTFWVRTFDYFQIKFQPSFVLRSKFFLPQFEQVDDSTLDKPGPYNTYSLNLYRHPTAPKLMSYPGYFNTRHSPYPFVNTIFLTANRFAKADLLASSLVSTYAHVLAEAADRGELLGTTLEQPVTAQCVATDGTQIAFLIYQLNTLSLQDDRGIWNHAWTAGPLPLMPKTAQDNEGTDSLSDLQFVDYLMYLMDRAVGVDSNIDQCQEELV